ncbi:MAG: hypothetical protein ACW98F_04890 [Candidatus Hodarchaeales archaeon]
MQTAYLEIIHFLGDTGYYARTETERGILTNLSEKGLIKVKKGTKNVYCLTGNGEKYLHGQKPIKVDLTDNQFLSLIREAYSSLATPMKPLVRIPEIREKLSSNQIPDPYFDKKVLSFHDEGVLTLATAMSKSHAGYGGITSNTGTGVFYYLTFEA